MIDLTKYELKPIYKDNVLDHYGLVPKAEPAISVDELKVLLESNGWKFYEELNGFRKESKYTIPMFSTDQQTNYDELSAGNYYELKQAIQSIIRNEKLKLLAEVRERVQVNQKGQFEQDGTGTVCWYLDDLVEALKELEAEL